MKNIKTIFTILMAGILILSLSACDTNKESKPSEDLNETTNSINENTIPESTTGENVLNASPTEDIVSPTENNENTQSKDDAFIPYIKYEDFGKDNYIFQEVMSNMRNHIGTITVRKTDFPNDYSKVDYQNNWVLDYSAGQTWSVDFNAKTICILGKEEYATEHTLPIDYYTAIKSLDKYEYVKIGNVLYGANKSISSNCKLIKIMLNDVDCIESYVESQSVKYSEWDHNWNDTVLFCIDETKYEYSDVPLTELQ